MCWFGLRRGGGGYRRRSDGVPHALEGAENLGDVKAVANGHAVVASASSTVASTVAVALAPAGVEADALGDVGWVNLAVAVGRWDVERVDVLAGCELLVVVERNTVKVLVVVDLGEGDGNLLVELADVFALARDGLPDLGELAVEFLSLFLGLGLDGLGGVKLCAKGGVFVPGLCQLLCVAEFVGDGGDADFGLRDARASSASATEEAAGAEQAPVPCDGRAAKGCADDAKRGGSAARALFSATVATAPAAFTATSVAVVMIPVSHV